jgi:hypothetical protein
MNMQSNLTIPIACDLTAIKIEVRSTHVESARQLLNRGAQEVQELPDGFAFRYAADQYAQVTQFIANERLCCPFFSFVLEVMPANGPIWLRITGAEGVKDFLQSELGRCGCS